MARYYYDDPLAAAFMAKHFGMRFCNDVAIDAKCFENMGTLLSMAMDEKVTIHARFHIHPDSLRLLEPMVGDVWLDPLYGSPWIAKSEDCLPLVAVQIIRRYGLSFMWPKVES